MDPSLLPPAPPPPPSTYVSHLLIATFSTCELSGHMGQGLTSAMSTLIPVPHYNCRSHLPISVAACPLWPLFSSSLPPLPGDSAKAWNGLRFRLSSGPSRPSVMLAHSCDFTSALDPWKHFPLGPPNGHSLRSLIWVESHCPSGPLMSLFSPAAL